MSSLFDQHTLNVITRTITSTIHSTFEAELVSLKKELSDLRALNARWAETVYVL